MSDKNTQELVSLSISTHQALWVIFLGCLTLELLFVLLDLVVNWQRGSTVGAIRRLFNITREDGLASLFSVIQTFVLAAVNWLIYVVVRQRQVRAGARRGWLVIAVFFTYMAIDDGAAIHERLGTAADTVATGFVSWFPSYTWHLVVLPAFAAMGVFILVFIWRQLPNRENRIRLLAAIACLGLAVVLDFVEGLDDGYRWLSAHTGWPTNAIAHFSKSLEEFLEMLAITLLLVTCLAHLATISPKLQFVFRER